ncbi:MAG TPA: hypothetical protein VKN99_06775 [Polyangia bacterium]|nr:hypothetical protein [Polyangia bacterium]
MRLKDQLRKLHDAVERALHEGTDESIAQVKRLLGERMKVGLRGPIDEHDDLATQRARVTAALDRLYRRLEMLPEQAL